MQGNGSNINRTGVAVNHEGKQKNSPSVRFGNIAQMPGDKLKLDTGTEQEAFVVEAKSIGGYSGSPVFVHMLPLSSRPARDNPKTLMIVPSPGIGPWLLGVDCCHIRTWERVVDDTLYPVRPERLVSSNTGMMGVIPAWKLAEMFDMDLVKQKINEADALVQMEKRNSVGATDIAMMDSGISGDAVLRTMLNTPAAPRKTKAKKKTG